jgi:hypothetical protein
MIVLIEFIIKRVKRSKSRAHCKLREAEELAGAGRAS